MQRVFTPLRRVYKNQLKSVAGLATFKRFKLKNLLPNFFQLALLLKNFLPTTMGNTITHWSFFFMSNLA